MNIMAEENVLVDVMNMLEAGPTNLPAAAPGSDIPALREQLAILVSCGRCKESIGTNLTHEQVRRLEDKDVMKYSKRHEAFIGARTTEALIDSFLAFTTKALGMVVKLKDPEALKDKLKNVDTTQQVTSQTPATKQKNPKRVAAGKGIAERAKMAREAKKKALIEAQSIIANKQAGPPPADTPPPVADTPYESTKNVLTTTQWLSVISIVVSLAGIYYKGEEIKGL